MSLAKAIIDYLEDEEVAVFDEDVFIGSFPADTRDCLVVVDTGGFKPKKDTTSSPTIQVKCRDKSYKKGKERLEEVKDLLHDKNNYQLGNIYVYMSEAMQEVGWIGQDEKGNQLCSVNFHFRVKYY